MKIENLVRITTGVLLNSPAVDSIDDIKIDAKKINRGNLFIDINNSQEEIDTAVQNGAYCILTSTIPKISDEEVAWISVENLQKALIKLSRFFATDKNFKFVLLTSVQYKLAKCLELEQKAQTLSQEPSLALLQILSSRNETIFFVVESEFITMVDPTITKAQEKLDANEIIEKSIFYTSFTFKNLFIKDVRLPSLFIPHLCSLLDYLDQEKIEYEIENFNNFEHFYPQFINKKLEKREFGTTAKALIFENDFDLFTTEIKFIEDRVDLNSLIIFISSDKVNEFTCKARKIVYKNFSDIKNLENQEFRYALIYGNLCDFEEFLQTCTNKQMTLF